MAERAALVRLSREKRVQELAARGSPVVLACRILNELHPRPGAESHAVLTANGPLVVILKAGPEVRR